MKKLFGIIGFAGGVLFGLMFANKSGKEMRKEIATSKDEEVLPKIGKEFVGVGKNFLETVKDVSDKPVKDMIKRGQQKGNVLMREAKKNFKKVTKKIESLAKEKIDEAKKGVEKATKKLPTKKKVVSKKPSIKKKAIRK